MTPEQRVTAAIDCTPYAKATPDAIHHHPRERTTRMTTPTNPPAGDMTAPSEGRRTRLGEVIYGAMFEVQIDLRYGGAEKAEYIADAVRRALEEAEPGDHPDYADAALDAVRDALTSDDPEVVGAMAERVGLHEERATAPVWEQCDRQDCSQWGAGIIVPGDEPPTPHAHGAARWVIKARLTTPWREVPDAD